MIGATLAVCLAAAAIEPPRSTVQIELGVQSGMLLGDTDRARPASTGVPSVIGAHLGLRAWSQALADSGAAIVVLIAVEARHAFHAHKTEWLGRFGLGAQLWHVTLRGGIGFGLSWMPVANLRPIVPLTAALLVQLPGPVRGLVLGLGYERSFQLRAFSDLRAGDRVAGVDSRILVSLAKDFDLPD